jgi:HSP20 family protein
MLRDYAAAARRPDLLREMRRTEQEMNRLFGGLRFAPRADFPPVNVWAGADEAIVTAEIRGVNADQVEAPTSDIIHGRTEA